MLSPVLVQYKSEKDIINLAMTGVCAESNTPFIVPAIFLSYKGEKVAKENLKTAAVVAADLATIYFSGGVALASDIAKARRLLAAMEVAGAIGNIGINLKSIDPNSNVGKAVNVYNSVMLLLGVKNVSQGVYGYAKNLPAKTKTALNANTNLRTLFKSQYDDYKQWLQKAKSSKELDNLEAVKNSEIALQEKVMDEVVGGSKAGGELFSSAREFVRTKYGQNILNQLTAKFGAANDGAAVVILQKWGDDGLSILNKTTVNTLDDVAKELVKNKTMYRYVNETSYNFDKLKTQGLIDASPSQFPGYASLDKIDDVVQAKSVLQLPKEPTWVAEFPSSQIVNDVKFPTAKFNNADYVVGFN